MGNTNRVMTSISELILSLRCKAPVEEVIKFQNIVSYMRRSSRTTAFETRNGDPACKFPGSDKAKEPVSNHSHPKIHSNHRPAKRNLRNYWFYNRPVDLL